MTTEQRMNLISPGALLSVRVGERQVGLKVVELDLPESAILKLDGKTFHADLDSLQRERQVVGFFEDGGGLVGEVEAIIPPRRLRGEDIKVFVIAKLTLKNLIDFGD